MILVMHVYTGCQWHKEEEEAKKNPIFKGIREAVNICVLTGNRLFFAEVLFDSD